jgi:cob(I)alamin adenosyltransferase
MKSPREKYQNDVRFKALVDMMLAHIEQCNFTPSEMREAATLASILHEQKILSKMRLSNAESPSLKPIEEALDALEKWIDERERELVYDYLP